jgi:2-octaprenyl-6-methoxyphenol hydroxylase
MSKPSCAMPEAATSTSVDVLIRGAGPVGCVLALALIDSGLRISVFDSSQKKTFPFRPIALSYASRLILERVGAWDGLAVTPIETVHVSQQGGFGRARLEASDSGVPALGYVTDYPSLLASLQEKVEQRGIKKTQEETPARCEVHAEGIAHDAEEKRYSQDAVVALVQFATPAGTSAHERFTPEGPLALLPHAGRYALIWSVRPERARSLAELPENSFLEALSGAAGSRTGTPLAVGARSVQPLALRVRTARTAERSVYIGNAAQSLHPVAGQGLNLGLRDAWDLAQILREASDPGDAATLARYAATRRFDAQATIRVTDFLAGAFLGSGRFARAARAAALTALDVFPAPRRFFARRMIYGPSALP